MIEGIILPMTMALMTGVTRIERKGNSVTLLYEDGTTETAKIPKGKWEPMEDNIFSLVSEVQSQRKGKA